MEIFRFRYRNEEYEDPRREFLVRALTAGVFALGGTLLPHATTFALAKRAPLLPPDRSIYRLHGSAAVNGIPASEETLIHPGDRIETAPSSELVFVVGKDAFILRERGIIELIAAMPDTASAATGSTAGGNRGNGAVISALRVLTGQIVSVFGQRQPDEDLSLRTPIATVGVRGTGIYLESHDDHSYVCTCYGMTRLSAVDDPASAEDITSDYHDAPRFILPEGPTGQRIEPAPVINHTDMELILIEELVGRIPPFVGTGDYGSGADPADGRDRNMPRDFP